MNTLTFEDRAQARAMWNPRHAIEGWLSGAEAYGDHEDAAISRRALEIQAEWRTAQLKEAA